MRYRRMMIRWIPFNAFSNSHFFMMISEGVLEIILNNWKEMNARVIEMVNGFGENLMIAHFVGSDCGID
jgi:hypothetical protein